MKICVAQTKPVKGDIHGNIENHKKLTGLAVANGADIILFQPHKASQTYSKKYLHADEGKFFISGQCSSVLKVNETNIAPAICYELSVPEHPGNAFKNGAEIYIASAAKTASGVDNAIKTLSDIAGKYSMTVLMANCIGLSDGFECAGKTSVWNNKGVLAGQLNDTHEGIIIIDTATQETFEKYHIK